MKEPLLVFGDDNGSCTIYNLTLKQYKGLVDDETKDWEDIATILRQFEVKVAPGAEHGYVPAYVVELSKIYGFDVESN